MKSAYYIQNTRKREKQMEKFELITKDKVYEILKKHYEDRVECITISNLEKEDIAKLVVGDNVDICNEPYYFVYIKMVEDNENNKYGFVGGRTSLFKNYLGDINFSDPMNSKRQREKYMEEHSLKWCKDEIFIIRLNDFRSKREAIDIEHSINGHYENMEKNVLNLFD